jgi:hypothetical protein
MSSSDRLNKFSVYSQSAIGIAVRLHPFITISAGRGFLFVYKHVERAFGERDCRLFHLRSFSTIGFLFFGRYRCDAARQNRRKGRPANRSLREHGHPYYSSPFGN